MNDSLLLLESEKPLSERLKVPRGQPFDPIPPQLLRKVSYRSFFYLLILLLIFFNVLIFVLLIFKRPFKKTGRIMGTRRRAAGGVQSICPLSNLNSFDCIIIKLCENVCWQNILAKFDNQPDPIKHFGVMALELANIQTILCKYMNISNYVSLCFIFHSMWVMQESLYIPI